jgi:hypothetical protein
MAGGAACAGWWCRVCAHEGASHRNPTCVSPLRREVVLRELILIMELYPTDRLVFRFLCDHHMSRRLVITNSPLSPLFPCGSPAPVNEHSAGGSHSSARRVSHSPIQILTRCHRRVHHHQEHQTPAPDLAAHSPPP